jgi:hypothetical protein
MRTSSQIQEATGNPPVGQIRIRVADNKKHNILRLYLSEENTAKVVALCERAEVSRADLLTRITVAGLRAIEENGGRIALPLRFKVVEEPMPIEARYKQRDTTAMIVADKKR